MRISPRWAGLGAAAFCAALIGSAAAAVRTASIVIDKLAFGAVPEGLHVGDRLTWVNHDIFLHSATAAGAFDIELPPGHQVTVELKRPGSFNFICRYHPGMKGVIVVAR